MRRLRPDAAFVRPAQSSTGAGEVVVARGSPLRLDVHRAPALVGVTLGTIAAVARGVGLPALYVMTFAEEDPKADVIEMLRKLPKEKFLPIYRELKKSAKAAKGGP